LKSASLVGYFVSLQISWPIISTRLNCNPNENCLAATSSLLGGIDRPLLKNKGHDGDDVNYLVKISKALSSPDVCQTLKSSRQYWILQCVQSLINSMSLSIHEIKDDFSSSENMFGILLSVLAMTQDGDIKARAIGTLITILHDI
jgi:hypothetical protein